MSSTRVVVSFGGKIVKTTLAIAAVLALATSLTFAPAQAKHPRHHHKHGDAGMTTSSGAAGQSGPGKDADAPDASRPGGKGVSNKPPG